jgi:hypothetical protein
MITYVKKVLDKARNAYEHKATQILEYLDKEIEYEDSLRFYTDKTNVKILRMNYKPHKISNEIISLSSMPEPAIEEVIRINKGITEHTWGVILESDKVSDINIYIAHMNKIQINARQANFFVVTDSEDLLLKLCNTFNWMNKVFYICPNTYNSNIDDKYRSSINFHCLKHLDKHISSPRSTYMNMLKAIGGKQVIVPDPNRVFCFNSKRLAPEE